MWPLWRMTNSSRARCSRKHEFLEDPVLITAAGVLWLVYQQRRELAAKPVVSKPAVESTEQLVQAMLAID